LVRELTGSEGFEKYKGLAVHVATRFWPRWAASLAGLADLDDACQEAQLALWERILPRLDSTRSTGEIAGYIDVSITRHLTAWASKLAREHHVELPDGDLLPGRPEVDPATLADAHGGFLRGIEDFPRR
jgi:DNA-directed RNA polymerase specialized sigma24 family protein